MWPGIVMGTTRLCSPTPGGGDGESLPGSVCELSPLLIPVMSGSLLLGLARSQSEEKA